MECEGCGTEVTELNTVKFYLKGSMELCDACMKLAASLGISIKPTEE